MALVVPNQIADIFESAKDVFSNVRDIVQTVDSVYEQFTSGNIEVPPGIIDPAVPTPAADVSVAADSGIDPRLLLLGAVVVVGLLIVRVS